MTILIQNTPTSMDSLPTILFDNKFASGTLTSSVAASVGYPLESILDEGTVKQFQPVSLPVNITNDYGSATIIDSAAIYAHTLGSSGCTVKVQSSTNNTTWTDRATVVPTDNTTILCLFTSVSARYWRVNITGGATLPFIGGVILTKRFNFPAGVVPPYTPAWLSRDYELLTANTIGGQFIGNRVLRRGGSTQITLASFERDFGENDLLPFMLHYNLGKAFVWAAGPSIFSKDVAYVWRKEDSRLAPTFDQNGSWMSAFMEVYVYGE